MDENVAANEGDYAFCGVTNTSDYVAVVTVDESFAADQGDYTAGGVATATDYVAVVTVDERAAVNEGATLLMAWEMLLILLLLHRELGTVLSTPIAMLLLLLSNSPAGSQALLSTPPPAGETTTILSLTAVEISINTTTTIDPLYAEPLRSCSCPGGCCPRRLSPFS